MAFPVISDPFVFATVICVEVASIVLGSMWCIPAYRQWMTTGTIRGVPSSHSVLIKKLMGTIGYRAKLSPVSVTPAVNTGSDITREDVPRDWARNAAIHLFMRYYAELCATIMFMSTLTVVTFTHNGKYFPLVIGYSSATWIRSMMLSLTTLIAQTLALVFITRLNPDHEAIHIFRTGYHFLHSGRYCVPYIIWTCACAMFMTWTVFLQQAAAVYLFYS